MDLNSRPLRDLIGKSEHDFTLEDIMAFISREGIDMVNFMYPAADGHIKTLNFTLHSTEYLYSILTSGERVDGSSLFPFIEAGNSDIYVIPRLSTAFMDPFTSIPTICFLCAFFDKDGSRLELSGEYTVYKASRAFMESTGMEFYAMGELEYYVIAKDVDGSLSAFPASDQKGYHESGPFAKFNDFRTDCMHRIMLCGGRIKYGHNEVGNFRKGDTLYEQNEIEFLPVPVVEAADTLMLAKWVIRNLAVEYGLDVSFAPKITEGKAGSGLHIHLKIMKDGVNQMVSPSGLSDTARRAIAGMMELAPSITAFGNGNPTSYFRLVPNQEAPTSICWGDRNRSALVRVPLGWSTLNNMFGQINKSEKPVTPPSDKQTIEIRSSDCSADIYLLLSAVCTACRYGLGHPEGLQIAERTYVDMDIHHNKALEASLRSLPSSCSESADRLSEQRGVYEEMGVFDGKVIDSRIASLKAFDDVHIREDINSNPSLMGGLVEKYYYYG